MSNKVDESILQLLMLLENCSAPLLNVQEKCSNYLATLKLAIFSAQDSWDVLTTLLAHAAGKYQQAITLKQGHQANICILLGRIILDYWQRNDTYEQIIATCTYIWSSVIITYTPYLVQITGSLMLHYINLYMSLVQDSNHSVLPITFLQQLNTMLDTLHQAYDCTVVEYHTIYTTIQNLQSQHNDNNNQYTNLLTSRLHFYATNNKPNWCKNVIIKTEEIITAQQLIQQLNLPHPLQVIRFMNMSLSKEHEILVQANFAMMTLAAKLKFLSVLFLKTEDNLTDNSLELLSDAEPLVDFVPNPYQVGQNEIDADILLLQVYGANNSLQECTNSISNYKGSCRMLTCFCQDNTNGYYNAQGEETWFIHSCLICNISISKIQHAIRQPLLPFGWYGCYCSIECMCADMSNNRKLIPIVVMLQQHLLNYGLNDCNDLI